jgi:hypothetical protein
MRPPVSPLSHSTLLLSMASGLFLRNGAPQPLYFQALPDSFHCNGGVYPPSLFSSLSAHVRTHCAISCPESTGVTCHESLTLLESTLAKCIKTNEFNYL